MTLIVRSPKQCFQVLGQFRSAGVAGIHCYEHADRVRDVVLLAEEQKCFLPISHPV